MKIIKILLIFINIFIFTFNIGCSKVNGKDTQSIKSPINNNLIIKGTWKIKDISILDSEIENREEILSQVGSIISISDSKISVFNHSYDNPRFKLKVVNSDYILSHELKFKIEDINEDLSSVDLISLIDLNNLIGEFIFLDEEESYLFYSGVLLKLEKENDFPIEIKDSNNKIEMEVIDEDYNSPVGVMLALKTPRDETKEISKEEYRTLWISFKDENLQTIFEKEKIIFPRLNGIWEMDSKIISFNEDGIEKKYMEYIIAKPIEYVEEKEEEIIFIESDYNSYKNINFISNDYVSIERVVNNNSTYNTLPVDNINSSEGMSIEEIYNSQVIDIFERDFVETYNSLSKDKKDLFIENVDFTNFTLKRVMGKWRIISKLQSKNNDSSYVDFEVSINPTSKILNYDTLLIPWKELKVKFPFIEDAYTSPNGRIAIIVSNDKISIYELKDRKIEGKSLIEIELKEEEVVIMSEWATGSYVDNWSKAFKDGLEINIEEE